MTLFITNEPEMATKDFTKEIAQCIISCKSFMFFIPKNFTSCFAEMGSMIKAIHYKDVSVFDSFSDFELTLLVQRFKFFKWEENLTDYVNNRLKEK